MYDYDKEREAELATARRRRSIPASRASTRRSRCTSPARSQSSSGPTPAVPGARDGSRRDARGVRRARLEARGRLPDPQPHPPCARIPDQGRARDRGRAADPPARRRHEVRRRPGGDPRRVLRRARRQLLPRRPRPRLGLPRGDALRRPARSHLARDLPQELRLLALHRRPRPCRRRRLLRDVRRAAHLRRLRAARAGHRADVLRAHLLVQPLRRDGEREDLPASRRATTSSSRARRCARCSRRASCPRRSSPGPRSQRC